MLSRLTSAVVGWWNCRTGHHTLVRTYGDLWARDCCQRCGLGGPLVLLPAPVWRVQGGKVTPAVEERSDPHAPAQLGNPPSTSPLHLGCPLPPLHLLYPTNDLFPQQAPSVERSP